MGHGITSLFLVCVLSRGGLCATLHGIVQSLAAPVTDVRVDVKRVYKGSGTVSVALLKTDRSGTYRVESLPFGEYRLSLESPGFEQVEVRGIGVQSDVIVIPPITLMVGSCATPIPVAHYLRLLNTSVNSRVTGYIADSSSGKPVTRAKLKLVCTGDACNGSPRSGVWKFNFELSPGAYSLRLHSDGYYDEEYSPVEAQAGFETVYFPFLLTRCHGPCIASKKPVRRCE